jgi:hypothetical protein
LANWMQSYAVSMRPTYEHLYLGNVLRYLGVNIFEKCVSSPINYIVAQSPESRCAVVKKGGVG